MAEDFNFAESESDFPSQENHSGKSENYRRSEVRVIVLKGDIYYEVISPFRTITLTHTDRDRNKSRQP
jgi:hypothetical protein